MRRWTAAREGEGGSFEGTAFPRRRADTSTQSRGSSTRPRAATGPAGSLASHVHGSLLCGSAFPSRRRVPSSLAAGPMRSLAVPLRQGNAFPSRRILRPRTHAVILGQSNVRASKIVPPTRATDALFRRGNAFPSRSVPLVEIARGPARLGAPRPRPLPASSSSQDARTTQRALREANGCEWIEIGANHAAHEDPRARLAIHMPNEPANGSSEIVIRAARLCAQNRAFRPREIHPLGRYRHVERLRDAQRRRGRTRPRTG
jgi:hypothetical protein